jgi:hypothetical protein
MNPLIPTELQEKRIQQILSEPTKAALIASEMGVGNSCKISACDRPSRKRGTQQDNVDDREKRGRGRWRNHNG